jgi:hypothetical protein
MCLVCKEDVLPEFINSLVLVFIIIIRPPIKVLLRYLLSYVYLLEAPTSFSHNLELLLELTRSTWDMVVLHLSLV